MKRRDFLKTGLIAGGACLVLPKRAFATSTVISSFPYTITTPGTYILTQNHTVNLADFFAIAVEADDVTIDLQGYTLQNSNGVDTSAVGIAAYTTIIKNLTVMNGAVKNFHTGIYLNGHCNGPNGFLIDSIVCNDCYAGGITLGGSGNIIQNCTIDAVTRSSLIDIGTCSGALGIGLMGSIGCLIRDTTINLHDAGQGDGTVCMFFDKTAKDTVVLDCTLLNADAGIVFDDNGATGDYRDNTSSNVYAAYTGGNDLGGNT
jgi:hypothetical protein